ncbi:MAG: cyclic nucleotide-binding domain-containing protein [Desulfobacterales bacterium]|nr:cyclic nucleotide-binding domain-containing protein [Desulfobacterales bacterium]
MFQIADEHTFEDGQTIWEEGSFGDWIYLIQTGKVELSKKVRGEKVVIDTLRVDDILGEMGYIIQSPRIFTALAIGKTTLGIVDRDFLDQEYNRLSDDIKLIMRSLALRLNKASENVNFGRKSPRITKILSLVFKSRESLINAFTGNASDNGLLIKTSKPLPKGEKFSLRLQLPDNPDPLNIDCEVAWSRTQSDDPVQRPPGMGVKFIQISSADKMRLDQELKKDIPGTKS